MGQTPEQTLEQTPAGPSAVVDDAAWNRTLARVNAHVRRYSLASRFRLEVTAMLAL